jgi:hypothetical protein
VERLRFLVTNFARAVIEYQHCIAVLFREEKSLPEGARLSINRLQKKFDDNLAAILEAGVASQEFRISDIRLATLAIGGVISWMYEWYRPRGRLTDVELITGLDELILRMVGSNEASIQAARETGLSPVRLENSL